MSYGGAYERMLGYAVGELAGGVARWIDLVHPDDREAFSVEVRRSVSEKTRSRLQYRVRRKDGTYIVVEDNGRFILDHEGVIVRFVGFVSDVTERAKAEEVRAQEAATSAALARVGRELISSLETPVVLERLCRLTSEALGSDFSQTWIWKPDGGFYADRELRYAAGGLGSAPRGPTAFEPSTPLLLGWFATTSRRLRLTPPTTH